MFMYLLFIYIKIAIKERADAKNSTSICTKYHQCLFCFKLALQLAPHEPLQAERRSIIFVFLFLAGKSMISTCRPFMIVQGCLDYNLESLAGALPTQPPVPSAEPPIPLLSHSSLCLAVHLSSQPLIPLLSHPSFFLATHPSSWPPIPLLSHPSLCLAIHPSAQPLIPLLSHPSPFLATHPSSQPLIPLFSHSSLFLATHPSARPPIPLLSHSSLCLATYPSKRRTVRKIQ